MTTPVGSVGKTYLPDCPFFAVQRVLLTLKLSATNALKPRRLIGFMKELGKIAEVYSKKASIVLVSAVNSAFWDSQALTESVKKNCGLNTLPKLESGRR